MKMIDNGTRYEYINFAGSAALLHRTIRSTLAHLHVSLGHISNEKLQRMLQLNGAPSEVVQAVKHLQCQICARVMPPVATPKAAFQRPMIFNERIVADTFYVWDANNEKFAVTHVLDAFSLYQIAVAAKDPSAEVFLVKVIKGVTVMGLEDLQQAVTSVTASRNPVVVAIERKDGAVKRAWLRYQNKLKGMPLEFVWVAVVEEQEATAIAKEALEELEKQLDSGRVNAGTHSSSSSSSSSSEAELPSSSKGPGSRKASTKASTKTASTRRDKKIPLKVDPRYPAADFTEDEQEGAAPISQEALQKATSNLDNVPISIHKKEVPTEDPRSEKPLFQKSARPRKKARTTGERGDPAFRPFSERRAVFDEALSKTARHLAKMNEKLQPQSVDVVT
eukprot:s2526_g34.t1